MEKQVIDYPCQWVFKIIGKNERLMRNAVDNCMGKTRFRLKKSNTSRAGKYISLNLETMVENEQLRNKIYEELKRHESVTMIL